MVPTIERPVVVGVDARAGSVTGVGLDTDLADGAREAGLGAMGALVAHDDGAELYHGSAFSGSGGDVR